MRNAVSGAIAAGVALALTGAASAQSTNQYDYNANYGAATTVAPSTSYAQPATYGDTSSSYQGNYATSTQPAPSYTAPTTNYGTATSTYSQPGYAPSTSSYTQPAQSYTQPAQNYTQPTQNYVQPAQNYTQPTQTYGQAMTTYTDKGPSYAQPAAPVQQTYTQPSYTAPTYTQPGGSYTTPSFAAQGYGSTITSQPLPGYAAPGYGAIPATAYTPPTAAPSPVASAPIAPTGDVIQDSDRWSMSLPRYYPAIQACLRRSTAKNPVVANVQESGQQTVMLIGEGGSSSYSICKTGLTGTTIKANTDTRPIPPAFFRTDRLDLHHGAGSSVPAGGGYEPKSDRLAGAHQAFGRLRPVWKRQFRRPVHPADDGEHERRAGLSRPPTELQARGVKAPRVFRSTRPA